MCHYFYMFETEMESLAKGSYIQDAVGLCFQTCLLCKIAVGGKVEEGRKNEDKKTCLLSGIKLNLLCFLLFFLYKLWNLNIKIKDYSHSSLHGIRLILF